MSNPQILIQALENGPALIIPLIREMPPALLKRRPAPDRWSVHEHACHFAAVHPLFFSRLDLMLTQDHPFIKPYLPNVDDAPDALLNMDLEDALARFTQDRQRLVERLKTLSPGAWQRTAEHGEYSHYSVYIMFRHLALHDMDHAYEIEDLVLKKDWASEP